MSATQMVAGWAFYFLIWIGLFVFIWWKGGDMNRPLAAFGWSLTCLVLLYGLMHLVQMA
jgi:hypothetical protein